MPARRTGAAVPTFVAQVAPAASADPAKQLPGAIAVSNIDFKRGDGGAGRLILRFSGDGAAPDLRNRLERRRSTSATRSCRPACRSR